MSERTNAVGECLCFLGGPIIWAAHFFVMYATATLVCSRNSVHDDGSFLPYAILWTMLAVAALLVLMSGQLIKVGRQALDGDEHEGSRFLQRGSILLGAAALLAVAWSAVPTIMLPACS